MAAWCINREAVTSECLDGEVVAIHLGTGIYYSLRGSAAALWQALAGPADAAALGAVLAAEFEVAPATAARDAEAFLVRLQAEGVLQESDQRAATEGREHGPRRAYAPPVLERFADLQDLLLMDPIHDAGVQGWPHRPPASPS